MHPTTASYIAKSFAADREAEAARERQLAEFRRGHAADAKPAAAWSRRWLSGVGLVSRSSFLTGAGHAFGALLDRQRAHR